MISGRPRGGLPAHVPHQDEARGLRQGATRRDGCLMRDAAWHRSLGLQRSIARETGIRVVSFLASMPDAGLCIRYWSNRYSPAAARMRLRMAASGKGPEPAIALLFMCSGLRVAGMTHVTASFAIRYLSAS
jgi:hypothetical protein